MVCAYIETRYEPRAECGTVLSSPSDSGMVLPSDWSSTRDSVEHEFVETGRPPSETGRPPSETGRPPSETRRPPSETGRTPSETGRPPSETGRPPSETRSSETSPDNRKDIARPIEAVCATKEPACHDITDGVLPTATIEPKSTSRRPIGSQLTVAWCGDSQVNSSIIIINNNIIFIIIIIINIIFMISINIID